MHISQRPTHIPSFRLNDSRLATPKNPEPDANELQSVGQNRDRLLVVGGMTATLGAVVYAGCQGNGWGAVLGAGIAGATGMVSGLPMAMAGRQTTGDQISNYVMSSAASLTLGVAAGAFMGAQGHGLLAAAGVGAGAALLGRVGAQLL